MLETYNVRMAFVVLENTAVVAELTAETLIAAVAGLGPEHLEQLEIGPGFDNAATGDVLVHTVIVPAISQGEVWAMQCIEHAAVKETAAELASAVREALNRKTWCEGCRLGLPALPADDDGAID